jgi:hypothetical protein
MAKEYYIIRKEIATFLFFVLIFLQLQKAITDYPLRGIKQFFVG